jgi:hypothetical protein
MVPTNWRAHRDQEHHEVELGLAILLRVEFWLRAGPGASLGPTAVGYAADLYLAICEPDWQS